MDDEVVWLTELRRFAFLVRRDAFFSTVKFTKDGRVYVVDNDCYELWEERAIDYESDDDGG